MIVGAAHCTYICKDENEKARPACCCIADEFWNCSNDEKKCGKRHRVYEMTGQDAYIKCGEWRTGAVPKDTSGEEYNIRLTIKEIVRHPDYNSSEGAGPLDGNDLAIYKVDDTPIKDRMDYIQLYPACLPTSEKSPATLNLSKTFGIHSGWSHPPPLKFIQSKAAGYLKFYGDFYKQWHYKMEIMNKCSDLSIDDNPLVSSFLAGREIVINRSGAPLLFPEQHSWNRI